MATARTKRQKPIRVGVFGIGRGQSFAAQAEVMDGVKLVAVCDQREPSLNAFGAAHPGVTTYTNYDRMLEHDLDAVVLANYCTEHAPAAVQALQRGLHVMSECIACKTMGEAVELVRAVEASGKTYMLAENYSYMNFTQEMAHLYRQGEIGEFRYADGEYVHPINYDYYISLAPTQNHWRNWLPATYYCTHSLSPIMYITGLRPVKCNGFVIPHDPSDVSIGPSFRVNDLASVIMLQMENGGYAKLLHVGLQRHMNWYRVFGSTGCLENLRHGDTSSVLVHHEPWLKQPEEPQDLIYHPEFRKFNDLAKQSGHGGGDFFMLHEFIDAIHTGKPPFFDIYRSLQMSVVGILAYRSALNGNATLDIPSFKKKSELKQYEGDNWSPDPADAGPGQPAPSILGHIKKSPAVLKAAKKRAHELRPDWD
jgi:predicted dehydrogenase